jgi:hypothetical protein
MKLFSPSKAKFIATLLIVVAMWSAHKLENLIGDPLLARFAPKFTAVVEDSGDKVDKLGEADKSQMVRAGVIIYAVEIVVKVIVSYLVASIIVHFFIDRKLEESNHSVQPTATRFAAGGG